MELHPVSVPYKSPYKVRQGTHLTKDIIILKVYMDEGIVGLGVELDEGKMKKYSADVNVIC